MWGQSLAGDFDNMTDDGFADLDSMGTLDKPMRELQKKDVQPAPGLGPTTFLSTATLPIDESDSPANERAYYGAGSSKNSEAAPYARTASTKRKRGDQGSVFGTPSRSYTRRARNNANEEVGFHIGEDMILTPPASVSRGPRALDHNTPIPSSSDLDTPTLNSLTTGLDSLAHTITDLHKQYQKPMEDLARKVNVLSDRLIKVEAENSRLRAHVDESFKTIKQQTNQSIRDLDKRCVEVLHSNDEVLTQRRPVAGGAYGGPATTLPGRRPSLFADMLSNHGRSN